MNSRQREHKLQAKFSLIKITNHNKKRGRYNKGNSWKSYNAAKVAQQDWDQTIKGVGSKELSQDQWKSYFMQYMHNGSSCKTLHMGRRNEASRIRG